MNNTGLYPTADKILVEVCKVEEKSAGGIFLPEMAKDKEQLAQIVGTVLALGGTCKALDEDGYMLCPELEGIEVGDHIIFARYAGAEFPVDGVAYRIMRAKDVIGKCTRLPDSVIRGAQSSVATFGHNTVPQAA